MMMKEESEEDAVEGVFIRPLPFSLVAILFSLPVGTITTTTFTTSPPSLSHTSIPTSNHTFPPPLSPPPHPLPNPQLNSQHPDLPRRQKRREPAEQAQHDKARDHDRLQKPETPRGEDIQSPAIFSPSAPLGCVIVGRGGDLEGSVREGEGGEEVVDRGC